MQGKPPVCLPSSSTHVIGCCTHPQSFRQVCVIRSAPFNICSSLQSRQMADAGLQLMGDAALRCLRACLQGRRRTAAGNAGGPEAPLSPGLDNFAWGSVVPEGPLQLDSEFERRLATGACIACRLRGAVRQELGEMAHHFVCVGWGCMNGATLGLSLAQDPAGCSAI